MRTVEQHRAAVDALVPTMPAAARSLDEAAGLVLAGDLVAPIDLPPFDNSAMDGYAVRGLPGLPATLPVTADIPAGATPGPELQPGTAARIMTGAPLPAGTELIVPVELTDAGRHWVQIRDAPAPGAHIRRRGEDVTAGRVVMPAGSVLGVPQIGIAAALGLATVEVLRPPHVLLLSTGTELVEPGTPLQPGQIYESNARMLAAAVRGIGARATVLRFVPDDVPAVRSRLDGALGGVDLVVTTGGVSAGAYEVVKDALTGQGVEFVKVAMQPGGPQGAGTVGGVPIVTFPGNPVSAFVSFEVFLRPVLLRAMGFRATHRPVLTEPVDVEVTSPAGKRQFRRAVRNLDNGTVRPWGGPGSHLLSWLAGADSMLVIPEDVSRLSPGDPAEVWLLG